MRQLLILAIEGSDDQALAITHLALRVPRMCRDIRVIGEIVSEPFRPKEITEAARRCCLGLLDGSGDRVSILPEQTVGEVIEAGHRQIMALLDRHDREIERQGQFGSMVLAQSIGQPSE